MILPVIDKIKYVQSLKEVASEVPEQAAVTSGIHSSLFPQSTVSVTSGIHPSLFLQSTVSLFFSEICVYIIFSAGFNLVFHFTFAPHR